MSFRLVDEAVENVVDLFSNEGSETQELPINPMKCRLQKISFPRILRIEELQELLNELLINVLFDQGWLEILRF